MAAKCTTRMMGSPCTDHVQVMLPAPVAASPVSWQLSWHWLLDGLYGMAKIDLIGWRLLEAGVLVRPNFAGIKCQFVYTHTHTPKK